MSKELYLRIDKQFSNCQLQQYESKQQYYYAGDGSKEDKMFIAEAL
ncbi:MAG: hypothetical protein ACTXOO_04545 [Sodalis sp. (in: enterobacteria)]